MWSNSKLADLIRGIEKPSSGTRDEWAAWEEEAKSKYPLRFWLAEDGLDHLEDLFFSFPKKIRKVFNYINYRWILQTHALTASPKDLKRGEWSDLSSRFLPCMFNALVDFVEVECAWFAVDPDDKENKYKVPWLRKKGIYKKWRSKEAGLDYLKWSTSLVYDKSWGIKEDSPDYLKPTSQALAAKEILELYTWWTTERLQRVEPHEKSGYIKLHETLEEKYGVMATFSSKLAFSEKEAISKAIDICSHLEAAYEKEDEEMMIRLIKVRNHLWT